MTDELRARLDGIRVALGWWPGESAVKIGGKDNVYETLLDAIDGLQADIQQLREDAGLA